MFGFWLNEQQSDIEYVTNVALGNATRVTALENRQSERWEEILRRLGNIETEIRNGR
jgi:hypothetical protein